MKNSEIARVFHDMADLLELKGENVFKIRAYRRAAQVIEHLPKEMAVMLEQEEDFQKIPGVGEAIAKKSTELIKTGKLKAYESLKDEFPEGITRLLEIPGIGPKTAHRLSSELKITSAEQLEEAIKEGKVADLFRMGDKTAQNILHKIQAMRRKDQRIPIGQALPIVEEILHILSSLPGVKNMISAGSLRRFRETVGDIDIMGTADDPEKVINKFVALPVVKEVLAKGPTKASVILSPGLQADLRMVEHDSFGSLLQYFTGSKQHNITLRTKCQKKGLKLSEYGITDVANDKLEKFTTEEAFYKRLGMQYIPPEIREDQGEIELAEKHEVPRLVDLRDIKGDFHTHSKWSDGNNTIEEMTMAAKDTGHKYIAITDHSKGLGIAHGLTEERLKEQVLEIHRLNQKLKGFRILSGMEVDIRADGSIDMPDNILAELDCVVGAVHSSFNQSEERITRRIIKAIENPHIDIIAHPTSRLIGEREPTAIDMEAVFKAAVKHKKALEINAMPSRLDLKDIHVQRARELGVMLAIGTDSHIAGQLKLMRFGIGIARRGWCEPKHILNCLSLEKVLAFFNK
ncbi:MAG TPA: DNA polymerase/3'-5' exonuclease PolX [Thermodesulfobacteriota bacterium]|nr:DNA polymerase/3'-5' exonuclease PolX [Thermodesulfobacteriota bacterium]